MKMGKSKITYSEYQNIVRKQTWIRYKKDHSIFDLLIPLTVGVFIGLWESYRIIGRFELFTTGFVSAFAILYIYSVVYLFYFSREHVFIYSEQSTRIEQFWPEALDILVFYNLDVQEYIDEENSEVIAISFTVENENKKNKYIEMTAEIKSVSQTSFDPNTGEIITLPFFADRKVVWDNGETVINLRPNQRMIFYFAYIDKGDHSRLRFGEGGYTKWLFDREAIYQFEIEFIGKIEGEIEFRRFHYMDVVYANPAKNKMIIAQMAKKYHMDEIPVPFIKVIDAAELGHWYDYSSPFQRQESQKQKEAKLNK
jgi:hypothetical protein